jgi:hypothetical protein
MKQLRVLAAATRLSLAIFAMVLRLTISSGLEPLDPHSLCPEEKALSTLKFGRKPASKENMFHLGCEQMVIYQLAHLTRPEAKHFFEAGTNLGCTCCFLKSSLDDRNI